MTQRDFMDCPPDSPTRPDYDRRQMVTYIRLLDAEADGADWQEAVSILFGLDPDREPERARLVHDTHLARAHWMSAHGYRHLVKAGRH